MKKWSYVQPPIRRFQNDSVPLTCVHSKDICVAIVASRGWMGLWRHCWRRQWLGRVHCTDRERHLGMGCPLRFGSYFDIHFLTCLTFNVIKGVKNGCPCLVEIRGTQGCALATSLHSCEGSPTKEQPGVPLISTIHGQPFLTHLTMA